METNSSIPHIGSLIRTELEVKNQTVAWLAQKLNIKRPNCYRLLHASSVHTETLFRVSVALKHNFFADCARVVQSQI